jgi:hypothetical protein
MTVLGASLGALKFEAYEDIYSDFFSKILKIFFAHLLYTKNLGLNPDQWIWFRNTGMQHTLTSWFANFHVCLSRKNSTPDDVWTDYTVFMTLLRS